MYSVVAPGVPEAGPASTAFVATLSANVTVAFVVTTVLAVSAPVAVNVYSTGPNLSAASPATEHVQVVVKAHFQSPRPVVVATVGTAVRVPPVTVLPAGSETTTVKTPATAVVPALM